MSGGLIDNFASYLNKIYIVVLAPTFLIANCYTLLKIHVCHNLLHTGWVLLFAMFMYLGMTL